MFPLLLGIENVKGNQQVSGVVENHLDGLWEIIEEGVSSLGMLGMNR